MDEVLGYDCDREEIIEEVKMILENKLNITKQAELAIEEGSYLYEGYLLFKTDEL